MKDRKDVDARTEFIFHIQMNSIFAHAHFFIGAFSQASHQFRSRQLLLLLSKYVSTTCLVTLLRHSLHPPRLTLC